MSWESVEVVEVRAVAWRAARRGAARRGAARRGAARRTVSPRPQASIARAESTSPTTPETNFEQP